MKYALLKNTLRLFCILFLLVLLHEQASTQQFVGNYMRHVVSSDSILFVCEDSTRIVLQVCTDDVIRVALFPSPGAVHFDTSFVVVQKFAPTTSFTLQDNVADVTITTSKASVVCQKRPFRIAFRSSSQQLLVKERDAGGLGWDGDSRFAFFDQTSESISMDLGNSVNRFPKSSRPILHWIAKVTTST